MQIRPILVLGASGQVARSFCRHYTVGHHPILCRGRPETEITNSACLRDLLEGLKPCIVINTAAYTAVEQAEKDQAKAYAVNTGGAGLVAETCCEHQIPLIHISTDYVFDGSKTSPYLETDAVAPLNVYGASKAQGEDAIRRIWPMHLILRTAWIYDLQGHNFLKTMLRLAEEQEEITIVDDQHGSPTWTDALVIAIAHVVARLLDDPNSVQWGTYHLTNGGETTWYGFALEIFRLLGKKGKKSPVLKAIRSADFPSKVRRPQYSVLDTSKIKETFGIHMPTWQMSLDKCLSSLKP